MTATPQARAATDIDQLTINTIRTLSMDAVEKANSGHPGTPMALAPIAYLLYAKLMKHSPRDPRWPDRDRFVLSAGHASMLLYSSLYLTGYDLSLDELKNFRQWGSRTPGHPEFETHAPGVETTTGPLGQGFANGVGMAIAEAHLAARFNRPGHEIVNHFTYAICSDGDLMEGLSHEAASLAGHLKLGKLIYFYDDNKITIEGSTDLAYTEDVARRFDAYHWHTQTVEDGNDLAALERAVKAAKADPRPSLIIVRTHIGYGAPTKQDTAAAHGAPLGKDEIAGAKASYGWPTVEPFHVPEEALAHGHQAVERGRRAKAEWDARLAAYAKAHPELAAELDAALAGRLPAGWDAKLPQFTPQDGAMATRAASGKVLNAIAPVVKVLIGGSADLAESNNTHLKGESDFAAGNYAGRNMHFGVRELGMGAVMNGMVLHGGVRPYGGTFLVFSDYARPAIRLAALMGVAPIWVFTHDSIGLGEDGPTHQPIEHLEALRAIPHLTLIRPADANETARAWQVALAHTGGPVLLVLTRQKVPTYDRATLGSADGTLKGGYVLSDSNAAKVVLIGTGSEVAICVSARDLLEKEGIATRVVSMPSVEIFRKQDAGYQDSVLPPGVPRHAGEAGRTTVWSGRVGPNGAEVGLDRIGA